MLNKESAGLLLVDVQGKLATQMFDADALMDNLKKLIQGVQLLGLPVIWLEQLPEKLGATHPELVELLTAEPIAKSSFSGLGNVDVRQAIETSKKSQWLVAGIESHVCVYQSVRDLLSANHHVYVVSDAVSSRDPKNKELALNVMQNAGAQLTSVEMVLFELQKKAEGEVFKQLIQLIK